MEHIPLNLPKISVVITCYNLGHYLNEALDSVAERAGRGEVEVIVVDDGSTDPATIEVLDAMDPQLYTLLRQRNMGLSAARNNGIEVARGKYIIPLDADNRLRPAMFEEVVSVLETKPEVDIVFGDAEYFDGREGRFHMGPARLTELMERNRIDACAGFRKTLWERLSGYDEQMLLGYEDWEFWLRSLVSGANFHYTGVILFDYRVRAGSMVTNTIKHRAGIEEYIFNKPELRFLREHRSTYLELLALSRQKVVLDGRTLLRMLYDRLRKRIGPSTTAVVDGH
ncbi:MAG: glycosyltransferase [Flavobacteriales bacterium]